MIRKALQNPLVAQATSWSEEAIKEIHKLSRGYPFLVQCIAYVSYQEGTIIDAARVRASLNAALEIGKPWLSHVLGNASDNDIRIIKKVSRGRYFLIQPPIIAYYHSLKRGITSKSPSQ
jgi:hypothetical protein